MGLDNFWVKKDQSLVQLSDMQNVPYACASMLTNGVTSFRGKIYAKMVMDLTKVDLYQDRIDNETITEMSNILNHTDWSQDIQDKYNLSEQDYYNFVEMVNAHAIAGHELTSWW